MLISNKDQKATEQLNQMLIFIYLFVCVFVYFAKQMKLLYSENTNKNRHLHMGNVTIEIKVESTQRTNIAHGFSLGDGWYPGLNVTLSDSINNDQHSNEMEANRGKNAPTVLKALHLYLYSSTQNNFTILWLIDGVKKITMVVGNFQEA